MWHVFVVVHDMYSGQIMLCTRLDSRSGWDGVWCVVWGDSDEYTVSTVDTILLSVIPLLHNTPEQNGTAGE